MTRSLRDRFQQQRNRFEQWVTAPPLELSVERLGPESAWPGQYRDDRVQVAWEAWQESACLRRDED